MWVWVVVIVALAGGVAAVAVGRGGSLSEVYDDRPDATVPAGRPLSADDLRDVRFSTAVRGYRMDEVDALLARIRADMMARESAPPDEDVRVVDRPELLRSPPPPTAPDDAPREADHAEQGDHVHHVDPGGHGDAVHEDGEDGAHDETVRPGQHLSRRMTDQQAVTDSEREPT
jgi:DivIVA domain-containing protein